MGRYRLTAVWAIALALYAMLRPSDVLAGNLEWSVTRIEQVATVDQESAEAAFHFKNAGPDAVTILEIHSSCGCTTATLDKKTYAPGEEGDLQVRFTFGERTGPQQKEIVVVSTDTPTRPTELVLRVAIPEPFRVDPRLLIWKSAPVGTRAEAKSASIVSANGKPITVTKVFSDNAEFETQLVAEMAGQRYKLLVTPKSLAKPGKATLRLQIELPGGRSHLATIYAVIK